MRLYIMTFPENVKDRVYNSIVEIPRDLNWNLTTHDAVDEQRVLSARVVEHNEFGDIGLVAGVDVGFEDDNRISRAAAVVLTFPQLEPIESAVARRPVTFPYVPGLLAYREMPAVLEALMQLRSEPQMIVVDGHGRAHPRRFGIACHLGVVLELATIGCAKSILVGKARMPENEIGAWTPIMHKGEEIGVALRTRIGVSPVYVSIGNKVDLQTAREIVRRCTTKYRLPETTRWAHRVASGVRL
jgi:deoxyribonuclease V